jgi:hypothetical protein
LSSSSPISLSSSSSSSSSLNGGVGSGGCGGMARLVDTVVQVKIDAAGKVAVAQRAAAEARDFFMWLYSVVPCGTFDCRCSRCCDRGPTALVPRWGGCVWAC